MNELSKAIDISISGEAAEAALKKFRTQLSEWRLAMPKVPPVVFDFGLGKYERIGLIEYWVANEPEEGYCGKYLFVFDGQTCPTHRHKEKHETFFIVKGKVEMRYDGETMRLEEGDVLPVAQWKYHSFTGIGPALLLEISKPCVIDDNYFENTNIPIGGNFKTRKG